MFRKPDPFPSSCEGRETPTLLGSLESHKLDPTPHLKTGGGRNLVSETLCSLGIENSGRWTKPISQVILRV
jgi:hypothetical protein